VPPFVALSHVKRYGFSEDTYSDPKEASCCKPEHLAGRGFLVSPLTWESCEATATLNRGT
jgi:hypothetical protein